MLGQYVESVSLITGAFADVPYQVAEIAAAEGMKVWGFSEAQDEAGQRRLVPGNDLAIYHRVSYLPLDMQKVVGVLTGTGGIADELPILSRKISKAA